MSDIYIRKMKASDYESTVVSSAPVGLNQDAGFNCHMAFITCEGSDIRYRFDGGDPTNEEGHYLSDGESLILDSHHNIVQFRAIREGDRDAVLRITYGS